MALNGVPQPDRANSRYYDELEREIERLKSLISKMQSDVRAVERKL